MSGLSPEDLGNFNEHLTALADDAGLELDDADRMRLFQLSQEGGFNPAATEAAFEDLYGDFEDDDEPEYQPADEENEDMFDADGELGPGSQRLADDLQTDLDRLEARLGRPLLAKETEAFVGHAFEQVNRTGGYDAEKVQSATGVKSYQGMSRDEANEAMVERARDLAGRDDDEGRVHDINSDNRDAATRRGTTTWPRGSKAPAQTTSWT